MYKNFIITIICIVLINLCGCCCCGGKSSETTTTGPSSNSGSSADNKQNSDKIYKIGECGSINGTMVTVTKGYRTYGGGFAQAKPGNEFIVVHVKINNKSTDKINYNPFDFKMQNSKGQITDRAIFTPDRDTKLDSGELVSGGEVEGSISFEEPINDKGLILIYTPSVWSDNSLKFSIK
jgi:hypothetical protein